MSDNQQQNANPFGGRFQSFGATLRKSAQEMTEKAAAQVNKINADMAQAAVGNSEEGSKGSADVTAVATESSGESVPSVAGLSNENYNRNELMEVLQKMNKKVKALTVIRQQLTTQVENEKNEKKKLQDLVAGEILNGYTVQEGIDIIPQLQSAWRQQDEQNSLALQQLQQEFQKAQIQHQNGHASSNQQWESEKKQLIEQHQEEIKKLREELSNGDGAKEIQRVKDAAAAQMQAFKKKVAAARNAEITKVKTETAASAKKIMEARLNEQKEKFQQQFEKLKSEGNYSELLEKQKQEHAAELDKARAEAEASKAEAIAKAMNDAEAKATSQYESKLMALQTEHEAALERLKGEASNKSESEIRITALQKELEEMKSSLGSTIDSLKSQLIAAKTAAKEREDNASKEQKLNTDAEIAKTREEVQMKYEEENKKLRDQFSKEKEEIRLDFQQKWKDATARSQAAAAKQQQEAIQKVSADFNAKFQKMKKDIENTKAEEIAELKAVAEEEKRKNIVEVETKAALTRESLQKEMLRKINTLENEKQQQLESLRTSQQREKSLEMELNEAKSFLASAKDGQESSSKALEDALASQRHSFQEMIDSQKKDHNENVAALNKRLDELAKARDIAISELSSARDELQKRSESANSELDLIRKQLSETKASQEKQLDSLKSAHDAEMKQLKNQLEEKDKAAASFGGAKDIAAKELESLKVQYDKLKTEYEQAKNDVRINAEKAAEEMRKLSEEYNSIKSEMEKNRALQSELAEAREMIEAQKIEHEKTLAELRNSFLESSSKDVNEQIETIKKSILTEKDAEISALKADYEERLEAAAKKEGTVAQAFNKVKVAYTQKLKKTEEESAQKISSLQEELKSLEEKLAVLREENEKAESAWEKEKLELKETSESNMDGTLKEKQMQIESLQEKLKSSEENMSKIEMQLAETKRDLSIAEEKAQSGKASVDLDEQQKALQEKITSLQKDHADNLKRMEKEKQDLLSKERDEKERLAREVENLKSVENQKIELVNLLEKTKKDFDEEKANMRRTMEAHIDKMTTQFKEKLEASRSKASEEINNLQKTIQEKESQMGKLVDRFKALTASGTKLRDENEELKRRLGAESTAQKNLRSQLESVKKQLDETVANSSATAGSLLQQQENLEKDKADLENKLRALRGDVRTKSNKIEELTGKLQALSENLNAITAEQKQKDEQLRHASKLEAKLKATEAEVAELREQVNQLKLERTKNATLVEKLQAEKEANERNHGQRTALVGMLETQLAEMSDKNADVNAKLEAALYDLNQKEEEIRSSADRINKLERDLEEAKNAAKRATESLASAQKGAESKSSKMVESLQKEIQSIKQQMARKSAAAQRLLQQRETECSELRKTNKALQQEVDKGSYSDRRIFELAAQQSNRESHQMSEIEMRDRIIERLKEALVERDGDLASAEKHAHEVESQIEELFRIRRREDVNIDYLKSIIVKYLSLPPGSTERAGLLPVLATLLQFDEADYKTIEEGKNKVSWWGSSVIPTMISAPSSSPLPANSGSAEVSISQTLSTTGKRTSLQF